jgi:ubiquinone/menaquinone biosynthesis C-methylase UbiE
MTIDKSTEKISGMFDAIAPTYDKLTMYYLLCRQKGRKKAIDELMRNCPHEILMLLPVQVI